MHNSEKATHVYVVFVRQNHKYTKDSTANELGVIKPTNYKNSDGSRGNTNMVRRNLEGTAGDSKVMDGKLKEVEEIGNTFPTSSSWSTDIWRRYKSWNVG